MQYKKIVAACAAIGSVLLLAGCAPSPAQPTKTFTMDDVAQHASKDSCYTVIRGFVYDLTKAIDTHPGGPDKILGICGKDGTDAFVAKHGGKERQENALETFKIGTLAK